MIQMKNKGWIVVMVLIALIVWIGTVSAFAADEVFGEVFKSRMPKAFGGDFKLYLGKIVSEKTSPEYYNLILNFKFMSSEFYEPLVVRMCRRPKTFMGQAFYKSPLKGVEVKKRKSNMWLYLVKKGKKLTVSFSGEVRAHLWYFEPPLCNERGQIQDPSVAVMKNMQDLPEKKFTTEVVGRDTWYYVVVRPLDNGVLVTKYCLEMLQE